MYRDTDCQEMLECRELWTWIYGGTSSVVVSMCVALKEKQCSAYSSQVLGFCEAVPRFVVR